MSGGPTSYNLLERGIDRRGVVPQPSVCNPDYTVSLACEDRDWACKKEDKKSEQKHLYKVMLSCVRSSEGQVQVRSCEECKHKQLQIGMENTASHNQTLSRKSNSAQKYIKDTNAPPPDGSPPTPPPKSSRSSPSPLSK